MLQSAEHYQTVVFGFNGKILKAIM